MRFFKLLGDNLSYGMKVFANQIGTSIFALLLYTAVGSMTLPDGKDDILNIIISVFSLLFYILLIYTVVWEIGAKDRIRVEGGRANYVRGKGLLIALAAELPNLFFGGLSFIFGLITYLTESASAKIPFGIFYTITQFGLAGYMGIIANIFPVGASGAISSYFGQAVLYLVFPLLTFPILYFSYRLGFAERRILFLPTVSGKK